MCRQMWDCLYSGDHGLGFEEDVVMLRRAWRLQSEEGSLFD